MYGLTYVPDLGSEKENNRDFPLKTKRKVKPDFSLKNKKLLLLEFNKIKKDVNVILEIGVARTKHGITFDSTSTGVFIGEKMDYTHYFGVDVECKKHITGKNVHTIQTSSSNTKEILKFIEDKSGTNKIDIIFIDGWHSVNQVLDDWKFAENLNKGGIVFFHDSNEHPGPVEVIKAIDRNIFEVNKYFEGDMNDWGLAVVRKI